MKKKKTLRLISVIMLALVLLVLVLTVVLPAGGDSSSDRVAVFFVEEDRMFPQMDYHQIFSSMDIASYYSMGDKLTDEEVLAKVQEIQKKTNCSELILIGDGNYAYSVLSCASRTEQVTSCILFSPVIGETQDISSLGTLTPKSRVAIFSVGNSTSNMLYEHLSGEDTRYTRGTRKDKNAPELFISPDATRYYARTSEMKNADLASAMTFNSPIVQTYLADYLTNYVLGEKGVSRVPLANWVVKVLCTMVALVAFALFAATIPSAQKAPAAKEADMNGASSAKTEEKFSENAPASRPKGRSIFEKYHAAQNHLAALQLLLGAVAGVGGCLMVAISTSQVKRLLLIWVCVSFLSSAFYLLRYIRKIPKKTVRQSRVMWQLYVIFTILLMADIFLLMLLWRGAGFLKLDIFILISLMLSIMLAVALSMLELTDRFFAKSENGKGVLRSVKFSAIRFVPMVIVFSFSIIMKKEMCALQVVIMSVALLAAEGMRRLLKQGSLGDSLSVFLYACLYWMMF
ncbi:MAG: hypothetical protein J6Y08_03540 [Clostridiales bacterium]|nr:hypothetical protein [Clostridiales bacterium]